MVDTVGILTPSMDRAQVQVIHLSPHGRFAVVDLRSTTHPGTADVFHVGTGKRATPPRHFPRMRSMKVCKAFADWLDDLDPVTDDGAIRIAQADYHRFVGKWMSEHMS